MQRRSMLPGGRPRQRGQVNGLVALSYGVGFVGVIHRTSDSFFGADVMHELFGEASLRLLLDHFGDVGDPREAAKVKYPLREVLFLVTCATMAGCDDYDEIAAWGEHHIGFLRGYAEYYFGAPCEDWLRVLFNRIEPALFEACFLSWAASLGGGDPDLIALDGKTLRRSGDSASGAKP